jgi:hypothetical protein
MAGAALFLFGAGWLMAGVVIMPLAWHYLHDAQDGVMWLVPFSMRKYPDRGEVESHERVLEATWYQPSIRSRLETALGSIALISGGALAYHTGAPPGVLILSTLIAFGTCLAAGLMWSSTRWEKNLV